MSKLPVGEKIDKNDPSVPKEIQHLKEGCTKVFIMTELRDSECFMVHIKDFLTEFNCYELFYVK